MQFTRNLRVIFNFTLRVITRNVTVTYRNVTGLYNPTGRLLPIVAMVIRYSIQLKLTNVSH
jgi:multidrug efflux pump subunit AcrA (membrane-fusion protein)